MSTQVERPLSFHHFVDFFLFATFPIGKFGRTKQGSSSDPKRISFVTYPYPCPTSRSSGTSSKNRLLPYVSPLPYITPVGIRTLTSLYPLLFLQCSKRAMQPLLPFTSCCHPQPYQSFIHSFSFNILTNLRFTNSS